MLDLDGIFGGSPASAVTAEPGPAGSDSPSPAENTLRCPETDAADGDGVSPGPDRLAASGEADVDGMALPVRPDSELDAADRAAIAVCEGELEPYRPTGAAAFAVGVPGGWTASGWTARLRTLAAACEGLHPGRARELRQEAACVCTNGVVY